MDVDSEAAPSSTAGVDAELYSRQLYAIGVKAQTRIQSSSVLIVGARGLGTEIAKNLILMGVKACTLHDPDAVSSLDLAAQFYLTPADVGAPRASRCLARLAALNQFVAVSLLADEGGVSAATAARFDVIVAADQPEAEVARLGALARGAGRAFIVAEGRGVFGRVFVDCGPRFTVDDVDGEPPAVAIVEAVSSDAVGEVRVLEDTRHGLQDGDHVTFREVGGMVELNGSMPLPIKVTSPRAFTIGDTRAWGAYTGGGIMTQVKMPREVTFKPVSGMLAPMGAAGVEGCPEEGDFVLTDFGKFDRAPFLHAAFSALHAVAAASATLPAPGDEAAAAAVVAATAQRVSGGVLKDAERDLVLQLARGAQGHLAPMCASLGGIAAQEVLKALSGKFMPIRQWCYFDAAEALPPADAPLPVADVAPSGSRYDGQIAVFGRDFQARLGALRYFLVGAGAIGCEMLKNWAMMGVGCGAGGGVTVTDMDRIERSNLSRQFLFREADIGRAKSTTAVAAATVMNPELHAIAHESRVGPDTESTFDDAFWGSLSGVCTALDNVDARLYVDGRCVYYGRPMLESGTLGTKGNTQIVVPRLTVNYGASRDPPEKAIPVCTLKNFPNLIEHTLQWARDWFEGEFRQLPDSVNAYLSQHDYLEALAKQSNTRIDTLEKLKSALVNDRPTTLQDCVRWARFAFQELFSNSIAQLLHNFPRDTRTATGEPFWSGAKREPNPITFSVTDPLHMSFIVTATTLRGSLYGLHLTPGHHTPAWFAAILAEIHVPDFHPASGVRIAANDKELEEQAKADEAKAASATGGGAGAGAGAGAGSGGGDGGGEWDTEVRAAALAGKLPAPRDLAGFRCSSVEFEKDDDLHISFVTAASNLRARNYRIEEKDKHASKQIAGKIIPAIATTTALVAGLVCFELYKLVGNKPFESFRSAFANLAIPFITLSEPVAIKSTAFVLAPGTTYAPPPEPGSTALSAATEQPDGSRVWKWSVWDRIELSGPITLRDFLSFFRDALGVDVQMISFGATMIYAMFAKPAVKKERLPMAMGSLSQHVSKRSLPHHTRFITLEVSAVAADGEAVELPYIRYALGEGEVVPLADA